MSHNPFYANSSYDLDGWKLQAACRGMDAKLFFSDRAHAPIPPVCHDCPVKEPCLWYALAYDLHGVWGGMTEEKRKRIARQNNQKMNQGTRRAKFASVARPFALKEEGNYGR